MPEKKKKDVPDLLPGKRRAFFAITLLSPLVLLLLLELLLRLISYGPDLSLFTSETIQGKRFYMMNPEVKGRYFYRIDFHPGTSPDHFEATKSPGTFRVFCLGASTTVGYPYWFNGSFSTFLRDRLKAIFPQKKIEVINLGITATNSYTVADIARELPAFQPDCIIAYDGHNEFYGALGVASRESIGRSHWINRVYLRLMHFRTFILMRDLVSLITSPFQRSEDHLFPSTVMERLSRGQVVPFGSDLYREGLTVFQENLNELRDICTAARIPLILSTQVSNLRRQPPFISGPDPQTPSERVAFNIGFNEGITNFLDGRFSTALAKLRTIQGPETLRADLQFRIARCLDTLSRHREAARSYQRARDLDQLRFRASTDFNDAIRAMEDGKGIFVADVERAFAAASPDSLIGCELITEHLHPNLRGQFLIARLLAEILREHGLVADAGSWRAADTLSDAWLWEERNTTRIDEMIGAMKTAVLTSGWPFRDQPPTLPSLSNKDTLGFIVELFARGRIDWESTHLEAAVFYALHQNMKQAAREYRIVAAEIPNDAPFLIPLGELLSRAGNRERAVLKLKEVVKTDPSNRQAVKLLTRIGAME